MALALLEDGISLRQPKYTKLLARLAMQALELPPSEIHLRLSSIYKPELSAIFEEELTKFLRVPYPQNLGAWAIVSTLGMEPLAGKLIEGFWPCERESQLQLLGAIINEFNAKWFTRKLKDTILNSSIKDIFSRTHVHYLLGPKLGFPLDLLYENRNFRSQRISVRVSETLERTWWFVLSSIGSKKRKATVDHSLLAEWDETQDYHRDWLPFLAGSRFLSNPTKESLSHELKWLASQIDLPMHHSHYYGEIPWPLHAILAAAKSETELLEYASMIEQGKLGDLEEWLSGPLAK